MGRGVRGENGDAREGTAVGRGGKRGVREEEDCYVGARKTREIQAG